MFKTQPTPFDRDPSDRPLVRILLHSESAVQGMRSSDPYIASLIALQHFDFAEITFTPSDDPGIRDALTSEGAVLIEVERTEGVLVRKEATRRSLITYIQVGVDYGGACVTGSRVSRLASEISRSPDFDFFVVADEDPLLVREDAEVAVLTSREALNRVRILAANAGLFLVRPKFSVDETSYYTYRSALLFPARRVAWTLAAHRAIPDPVADQVNSLGQRLGLLCRAADAASCVALKAPNNSTEDRIRYHLAFFVMLATGIFDDLAWIADGLYTLGLKKHQATIKTNPKGQDPKGVPLLQRLHKHNLSLYSFLTESSIRDSILAFYPIRDQLQHRSFMTGGLLVRNRTKKGIFVFIDSASHRRFANVAPSRLVPRFDAPVHQVEGSGVV